MSQHEILESLKNQILEQQKLIEKFMQFQTEQNEKKTEQNEKKTEQNEKKTELKILFASTEIPFKLKYLKTLCDNQKISEAKNYLQQYFTILQTTNGKGCYVFWDAYSKSFSFYDSEGLRVALPTCCDVYDGKVISFSSFDYVKNHILERFRFTLAYTNDKIFEKDDQYFINKFEGFLHQKRKSYQDFPAKIKKGVELMWAHIREVWCSDNKEQFIYVKKWLSAMISGQKMTTALYLKSVEGTGKTAPCDFIRKKVLGENNCYTLDNPECLQDGYNYELYGKMAVICEEMPSNTEGQWRSLVNWMKTWVTNSTKAYKGKYIKSFNGDNISSFIIVTNNDAFIIHPRDRRYVMLDVSSKYIGNTKYFDELWEIVEGPDSNLYGEAFYWYCIEYYEKYLKANNGKKFNPQADRPVTKTKQGTIIDHLHTLYVYLKKEFIVKKKCIDEQLLSEFRRDYIKDLQLDARKKKSGFEYIYKNHDIEITPRKIGELLREIDISTKSGAGNYTYVCGITYEQLLKNFQERNWIDSYDDIEIIDIKKFEKKNNVIVAGEVYEKQTSSVDNDILSKKKDDIAKLDEQAIIVEGDENPSNESKNPSDPFSECQEEKDTSPKAQVGKKCIDRNIVTKLENEWKEISKKSKELDERFEKLCQQIKKKSFKNINKTIDKIMEGWD